MKTTSSELWLPLRIPAIFIIILAFMTSTNLVKSKLKNTAGLVYGFKEKFIILTKASCNILHHKSQTVSTFFFKKRQRRDDFMLS